MTAAELLSLGTLLALLVTAFVLGAAPVFVVRGIAAFYPKGHKRRAELVAEMKHVEGLTIIPQQWLWLGEMFAVAVCEGIPLRVRSHRRRVPAAERVSVVPAAYKHTNSKGVTLYLHSTEVTLRGGKAQTIYFMAKVSGIAKGQPCDLPPGYLVKENPRNGFLTICKKPIRNA